jgi:hypothetical protein
VLLAKQALIIGEKRYLSVNGYDVMKNKKRKPLKRA